MTRVWYFTKQTNADGIKPSSSLYRAEMEMKHEVRTAEPSGDARHPLTLETLTWQSHERRTRANASRKVVTRMLASVERWTVANVIDY